MLIAIWASVGLLQSAASAQGINGAQVANAERHKVYPKTFLNAVRDSNTALMLAELCPTLKFVVAHDKVVAGEVKVELIRQGYAMGDIIHYFSHPPYRWVTKELFGYAVKHRFVPDDTAGACKAGHAEVRRATAIGKYLTSMRGNG